MLHDGRTTGVDIGLHHGHLHIRKWWERGENCPIAVAVTPDPYLFFAASNGLPWGRSEYEFAGYVKGAPLEVIRGPRTGLPLPANAELVIEGEVPPPSIEQRDEGPFGEFTGYYSGAARPRPVIRVQALYHRHDPILQGDPPLKPPGARTPGGIPSGSVLRVWDDLDKAGIPGVMGVYDTLGTEGGLVLTVAIRQQYAGHARQVGRVASGLVHAFYRVLVVVDDDVDPSKPRTTCSGRSPPAADLPGRLVEIQTECPSSPLDPMLSPEMRARGDMTTSRAVIIACRPWLWRDAFPVVNRVSDALRQEALGKWRTLFE